MPLLKILKIHKGQIGIWKIDEKEINSNQLNPTPSEYHPKVFTYKSNHKIMQVLSARLLAQELLPDHQLLKNKLGKPYLNPDTLSISISNDQDLVAMIINSEKCGIDIQTPKRKIFKIKKKFINKDDFSYDGNNEDLLWTWCAKESMYKIFGIPEIFFKDHLKIKVINENTLYGECIHEKYLFSCQLNKLKINNHFLVYTSNFETN
jgi:phosphopantetheinyl transferase